MTFFTSFGNPVEATRQGVAAGADAVHALNNSYAGFRRAKAQEALNLIQQDMDTAARKFADANREIGGTPATPGLDHSGRNLPGSSSSAGVPSGASGGYSGGGYPSGGGWSGDGYSGGGPGGGFSGEGLGGSRVSGAASVSSGGGGLVPLPAGVDPSRVPEGHYGTYDPNVLGPDGVPVVTYHPLPDQRGAGPGGLDGRIDPDGPVSSGTTDFGSALNPAGAGAGAGYGSGVSGVMAGAGSAALLGGAGLVSRGGLTGGGLTGAGAGPGSRGASLGTSLGAGRGTGTGAGGGGAGAGTRAGAAGGSGALGEGTTPRSTGSATTGAGATGAGGAGKGGMSMMGGQPMGAQSGEKKNQPGSLGLIAPHLEDEDDKPVMPPSAGAGSRERR